MSLRQSWPLFIVWGGFAVLSECLPSSRNEGER
jgi:hypothetical protein